MLQREEPHSAFSSLLSSELYENSSTTDEDDEDDTIVFLAAVATAMRNQEQRRLVPHDQQHFRTRVVWEQHVEELDHREDAFRTMYRMHHTSFLKLCALIDPFLKVNPVMSRLRTAGKAPITTEIALHCLLRWLSGGSFHDIRLTAGISKTAFYRAAHQCASAILQVDELAFSFQETADELSKAAADFKEISSYGVIDGCVACLDGLLLPIQTPRASETGHVKSYFSGHYQMYGVNVQAACDAHCRFVYAAVAAPGGTNDVVAFRKTSLSQKLDKLPMGKYGIADNAFVCTDHLLTPFPGTQRHEPGNDTYNFFLSQVRIRIEMTFGIFMSKWGLFKRPLQMRLKNVGRLFMCATRLHNFCINEEFHDGDSVSDDDSADVNFTPVMNNPSVVSVPGSSFMRNIVVAEIQSMSLTRPVYNLQRNNERDNNNVV
jgi:DDE superfamily endonuclease